MPDLSHWQTRYVSCRICPRECNTKRSEGEVGYCNSGTDFQIASICNHKGEEPVLSGKLGICNVFFSHCNLQCTYCQNFEISSNSQQIYTGTTVREVSDKIIEILGRSENILGFVSPTHQVVQMIQIIEAIHSRNIHPTIVYNSNGYESTETLRMLEPVVDVYLPDYKYADRELAKKLSGVYHYPDAALKAIREMYRQKGSTLQINQEGLAVNGLIIRHLVLPGYTGNSRLVLQNIAQEISTNVNISLMSQYYPAHKASVDPVLNRTLTLQEFETIKKTFYQLGFHNGWLQEPESNQLYRPDFSKTNPFED